MRLTSDAERVRAVLERIDQVRLENGSVLPHVLADLRELTGSSCAAAYLALCDRGAYSVEFAWLDRGNGVCGIAGELQSFLADTPQAFGSFRPERPAPDERNVAIMPFQQVPAEVMQARPLVRDFFRRIKVRGLDLVRLHLCDADDALAWVGVFREQPYGPREAGLVNRLARPLRDRLLLERMFERRALAQALLGSLLDELAGPAFVVRCVRGGLTVEHANEPGRCLLASRRRDLLAELRDASELRDAASGRCSGRWKAWPVRGAGVPSGCHLVLPTAPPGPVVAARMRKATARWDLTNAQARVLRELAEGRPNKVIADRLGCAVKTVELHVHELVRRAGADNRTDLVRRFWTLAES